MTVSDVVEAFAHHPKLPVTNSRDITAEACRGEGACSVAVRAEEIAIYRFDDREDAATFVASLGDDGYQSDWIVLEYPHAAFDTDTTKLSYAGIVDSMWTSD